MIRAGDPIVVYLREPRERLWGILRGLDAAGITVEGCDLDSFDAWLRSVAGGEEPRALVSVFFFPMGRVERLLLDRAAPGAPSLAERFRAGTGRAVGEVLAAAVEPE
jgi:hypothetical protein